MDPTHLVVRQTAAALLQMQDEPSAQSLAEQLVRRLNRLDSSGYDDFFTFLLTELGPDHTRLHEAVDAYMAAEGDEILAQTLADAAVSARTELFSLINTAPRGIEVLLGLRTRVLQKLRERPELTPIDADLERLFRGWFNRGFLELRRLDWTTPAHVLEKLIEYEAVHEIQGWDDLRRRLAPDRRSFGFFHPSLPDEPIIFVEVALTRGMASSIQDVLHSPVEDEIDDEFDSAIFYSITNCQEGLRGISFGDFLIKRVSQYLQSELPDIETFATLSPIPGLARWIEEERLDIDMQDQSALLAATATYLLAERRGRLPLDPVARFHLRNGARVERINWRGDTSEKGLGESFGLLVNYRYSGQDLAANHEALVHDGLVIASPEVIDLLNGSTDNLGGQLGDDLPSPDTVRWATRPDEVVDG